MMQLNNPVLLGVFVTSITAISTVIATSLTSLISNYYQTKRENEIWLKSELRNIYGGAIQSLATLLTLSGIESNMDAIEEAIVDAKKWLALSLIYFEPKQKKTFKVFEDEIYLFTSGQYKYFLEKARIKGLQPAEKYQGVNDVYGAADVMLKRIIEVAYQDKRLS
ncbi:hypothetical protein H6F50_26170 [Coleofasciculus sp. FACHB-712]|uniref:hypothetical protein n=1 Tax=Coleofasciculus sp. FACHB-712 TaxID=2692789 RepID=UPI001689CDB4|nr:hypothetical protein [Coleofasciculus sp. FACHB-712]MBD1945797.1 hypothetical protein [Coleofasciculus sp. FACHB-712]